MYEDNVKVTANCIFIYIENIVAALTPRAEGVTSFTHTFFTSPIFSLFEVFVVSIIS